MKEVESQLRQACAASKRDAEERDGLQLRRLKQQLENAESALREGEV